MLKYHKPVVIIIIMIIIQGGLYSVSLLIELNKHIAQLSPKKEKNIGLGTTRYNLIN